MNNENAVEAYQYVYLKLHTIKPDENNDNMFLKIKHIQGNNNNYYDVYGFTDQSWALDFSPWSRWLGLYVDNELISQFSNEDIIAHCLWEMTFHGFMEEDIQEKVDELKRRVESIKNGEEKLISWDEVFNESK